MAILDSIRSKIKRREAEIRGGSELKFGLTAGKPVTGSRDFAH